MLYDITAHPLLSLDAARLSTPELAAHASVAETVLRFDTFTPFDVLTQPDQYTKAQAACALQVSFQVEAGLDAFIFAASRRGGRTQHYRRPARNMTITHPVARKMANALRTAATTSP